MENCIRCVGGSVVHLRERDTRTCVNCGAAYYDHHEEKIDGSRSYAQEDSEVRELLRVEAHPARGVSCPQCGVDAGSTCRSPVGNRMTFVHAARQHASNGTDMSIPTSREISCPRCGVEAGKPCKTPSGNYLSIVHADRRPQLL